MNQAFIDGQNLIYSARNDKQSWDIDLAKFRFYLLRKYNVDKAYYFIGYYEKKNSELYNTIKNANFHIIFREHATGMKSIKKGNVDTDIVFEIMRKISDREDFDKIVLVSGDGDYYKMVNYLINKNKFMRLLAPSEKRMSSLYRKLGSNRYMFLDRKEIKKKIGKNAGSA
ncbi:MAG: NYN domain-containing protein [Coriobacteriia bacterium]|nr:NYN domain-containing protein [Coriobacteriia bacterium]